MGAAMSQDVTIHGTTYTVPQSKEKNWGNALTSMLVKLGTVASETTALAGTVSVAKVSSADSTISAGATLTPTAERHRVQGNGGPVTLDATTAIADGATDGQRLTLLGLDDTNWVEVPDGANTNISGPCLLMQGEQLELEWDSGLSVWVEKSRNN